MPEKEGFYGAVEAGGTKFVCAVGTGPKQLEERIRFPTTSPEETLGRTLEFFKQYEKRLLAIGIGSFGPLDVNPKSPTFGCIEKTPKPGWSGTPVLARIRELGLPVAIDMDVASSAMGEYAWGAGKNLKNFLYITIGTGIGATALLNGKPLSGLAAPEMGHLLLPAVESDDFEGVCPFHHRCLEGLASGPAIEKRWGRPAKHIEEDHPAWELEAEYVSSALVNYILTLSPERIIIGGGVAHQESLFPLLREKVLSKLNGYVDRPEITRDINRYIVPPGLGNESGILGCFVMAKEVAN